MSSANYSEILAEAAGSVDYWQDVAQTDFAREMHRRMKERGVSAAELARRMGTSKAYVSQLLDGGNFTLLTMVKVAMRWVQSSVSSSKARRKGHGPPRKRRLPTTCSERPLRSGLSRLDLPGKRADRFLRKLRTALRNIQRLERKTGPLSLQRGPAEALLPSADPYGFFFSISDAVPPPVGGSLGIGSPVSPWLWR